MYECTGAAHKFRRQAAKRPNRQIVSRATRFPMLLHCHLNLSPAPKLRVCAVSYLNTAPLVWGMLHGAQHGLFDLIFRLPSECADLQASGQSDIGLVPTFELTRHDLGVVPGVAIASRG